MLENQGQFYKAGVVGQAKREVKSKQTFLVISGREGEAGGTDSFSPFGLLEQSTLDDVA